MSDTPRTDESEFFITSKYEEDGLVYADFCRQLERELKEMHATALDYAASSAKAHAELSKAGDLLSENRKLRSLLSRYRKETPLGNQPHMIAHEVDAILDSQNTPIEPQK